MGVRIKRLTLCWALLALFAAVASRAEIVPDLHSAEVPVANQSSSALTAASRDALKEVLVKASGSYGVLKNPVIVAALAKPRSNLLQYAYVDNKTPAGGLSAHFEFDPGYITDLLVRAGAPLWTANRPPVLAWVVVDEGQGRHFVNPETEPEQARQLVAAFSRRGVPVRLPLFDLTDTAAVSLEDAWRLDGIAIQSGSARYHVKDVIVGRLASLSDGKSSGEWRYFHQGDRTNRSVSAPDFEAFAREGANIVAGQMAARYAIAPREGGEAGIRMSVTGVTSYADYAAIVGFLEDLELVEYANIVQVRGDRIELLLQAQADASQLASIIEINTRLLPAPVSAPVSVPAPAPVATPGSLTPVPAPVSELAAQLSYQWQN